MTTLASPVVIGGLCGVVVALLGYIGSRKLNQGNYTRALVEASNAFATRLDERNQKLEDRSDRLEAKADELEERIDTLVGLLKAVIPLLDAAGHDATVAAIRTAIRGDVS